MRTAAPGYALRIMINPAMLSIAFWSLMAKISLRSIPEA
jgi:hypothetical protein